MTTKKYILLENLQKYRSVFVKIYQNTASYQKIFSSSLLLAPGFLYKHNCFKIIYDAEWFDDDFLNLGKILPMKRIMKA